MINLLLNQVGDNFGQLTCDKSTWTGSRVGAIALIDKHDC